jgi:membrane-bound lytic murein transglycosylase B
VRRALAVLLATGAAAGVAVAVAQDRHDGAGRPKATATAPPTPTTTGAQALPAPDAALPHEPGALAATLTATTRRLRAAQERWDGAGPVPPDVTYLALHHQRMLRLMAFRRALGNATLALVAPDVRGEARDTVRALRSLRAIPRTPSRRRRPRPRIRVAGAAPAAELRGAYRVAERRFGVPWSVLAAINFVESAFGRLRNASAAGARGPMQFLPSTWRQYGMGGDIDDPRDAILGAAHYLRRAGAPANLDRALFAYNHSTAYVRAIRRFAARMAADERAFRTYYAWQVYVRTAAGVRRVTGPGRPTP